ncbi:MAG: nitrite/sulfite reductase [Miltoncostaeaceae bacterium]
MTTSANRPPDASTSRPGSIDNPEVYADLPGHVIPVIESEFDDFDTAAARYARGEIDQEAFDGVLRPQGVYGQRQPDVQMVRLKIPFGGINAEQMDALADAVERWAPLRKAHITTRQCIQIHHLPLADLTALLREVGTVGLTSREGCGNTVRNVTGDPRAGLLADEPFDPTPYAAAYARYFVRNDVCQLMPRKFKTAFAASSADRVATGIHDGGFIPRVRIVDGMEVRGFEIRIGGGTSIMPRVAPTLFDFVEADNGDFIKVTEAVLRVYDRRDELRRNRARARIKVLVDAIGMDAVRALVEDELAGGWVGERDFGLEGRVPMHDEEAHARAIAPRMDLPVPSPGDAAFVRFAESNVHAQRQEGFSTVEVRVPRGDLDPDQFRGLAAIMREFCGGYARTSIQQNLVLRWVRDDAVFAVWQRLDALGLGQAGADEVRDVVSCPGSDSCRLAITSSMGLNRAVEDRVTEMGIDDPLARRIRIKMSGCPNGCSQHHIADIGFYGASLKVGDRTLPAYVPHVGGGHDDGVVGIGHRLKVRLPAKRVPEAVSRWIGDYQEHRRPQESFREYVARVGTDPFEDAVRDLALPVEYGPGTIDQFIDWNRTEEFAVTRGRS